VNNLTVNSKPQIGATVSCSRVRWGEVVPKKGVRHFRWSGDTCSHVVSISIRLVCKLASCSQPRVPDAASFSLQFPVKSQLPILRTHGH